MTFSQKKHLLDALLRVTEMKKSHSVVLWIDQVMGQRNPLSERDWVQNGILPYFAFDVLILQEQNDQNRCWLFLERLIAEKRSIHTAVTSHAHLFEMTHSMGTISRIQEICSRLTCGILSTKEAYDENDNTRDNTEIRNWAIHLLRQDVKPDAYNDLVSGSQWQRPNYNLKEFINFVNNHLMDDVSPNWITRPQSTPGMNWTGVVELFGMQSKSILTASMDEMRQYLVSETTYTFKVFISESNSDMPVDPAIAIGFFNRKARPARVIICALSGFLNTKNTRVLASCIQDCCNLLHASDKEFMVNFDAIGGLMNSSPTQGIDNEVIPPAYNTALKCA